MKPVAREEILDFVTYEERRGPIREAAMAAKDLRRVHAGPLTFLFENRETVRYQILEMVRAERMVKEADIRHELETYNALLGREGDLGATLLIEIPEEAERNVLLRRWRDLPGHVLLELEDGRRVPAQWDEGQMSEEKLSSVQFLRFPAGRGARPAALAVTYPGLDARVALRPETREALAGDLGGS